MRPHLFLITLLVLSGGPAYAEWAKACYLRNERRPAVRGWSLYTNTVACHVFVNARRAKLMRRAVPTLTCVGDTAGKLRA